MYPENNLNEQEETKVSGNAPEHETTETAGNTAQIDNEKVNESPNTYAQNPNLSWQNQGVNGQNPNVNGNPNFSGQNPNFNGQNPNFNVQFVGQSYGQQPYGQPPVENPGKGLGIAGFVLSLCSFFSCCIHPFISFVLIIVGMILSIVGRVQSKKAGFQNGLATAGMIISIVHAVIWVLLITFAVIAPIILGAEVFEEIMREYPEFAASM